MSNEVIDTDPLRKLRAELDAKGLEILESIGEVRHSVLQALVMGANEIRNSVIDSMFREKKSGKFYKRGSKEHQASAPGQAPAVDMGELARSIIFDVREQSLEVEVGAKAGAPYAKFLEFGTAKMKPRPFLGPAVEKNTLDIINMVNANAFEVLRKAIGNGLNK